MVSSDATYHSPQRQGHGEGCRGVHPLSFREPHLAYLQENGFNRLVIFRLPNFNKILFNMQAFISLFRDKNTGILLGYNENFFRFNIFLVIQHDLICALSFLFLLFFSMMRDYFNNRE
jgi:hypothetical protein